MQTPESKIDQQDILKFLTGRGHGVLSVTRPDGAGPYGSLVAYALDAEGTPVLLFSALSEHTRCIEVDERVCLVVEADEAGFDNPQRIPRVSLMGTVQVDPRPEARAAFLERHPEAAVVADFDDFRFFRLDIAQAHWLGGFARSFWLTWH